MSSQKGVHDIIALNLASPVNPGGGVRRGAKAQEEDLSVEKVHYFCRKLESKKARSYYDFNKKANTFMGTDAMMITPVVQIIREPI